MKTEYSQKVEKAKVYSGKKSKYRFNYLMP